MVVLFENVKTNGAENIAGCFPAKETTKRQGHVLSFSVKGSVSGSTNIELLIFLSAMQA